MPVNSTHPDYDKMAKTWKKCRACIAGEDAVKEAGTLLLPMLTAQTGNEYASYLERALYFNAAGRTHDVFQGLVMRTTPIVKVPSAMKEWLLDIAFTGELMTEFIGRVVDEVLQVGRVGILVDMQQVDKQPESMGDYARQGIRQYFALFKTEDIINWKERVENGKRQLTMLVLREAYAPATTDKFVNKKADQYKVFELINGVVVASVYREMKNTKTGKNEWVPVSSITLKKSDTEFLDFIPFVIIDPVSGTMSIDEPPLLDVVNVNVAHYRNSADYENGLHLSGLPTPVFIGDFVTTPGAEDVTEVRLGSSSGIHLAQGGSAQYLEFNGAGMSAITAAMAEKRDMMAVLGARALGGEKNGVEAAQTVQMYRAGEASTLAGLANAVSKQLGKALEYMRDWARLSGPCSVQLNMDYMVAKMDPSELTAWLAAIQAGSIPVKDFFNALRRGGMIDQNRTFEDFQAETKVPGTGLEMTNKEVPKEDGTDKTKSVPDEDETDEGEE